MSERMRRAMRSEPLPAGMEIRIAERLRGARRRQGVGWAVAAAAGLALLVFGVPFLQRMAAEHEFLSEAEPLLAAVLRPGLQDHVHCAVHRKYADRAPRLEQAAEELPAEFRGLAPVVRERLPEGFEVHVAHVCKFRGRSFVHFVMRRGAELASLMATRREEGEELTPQPLLTMTSENGVDVYGGGAMGMQVSAVEGGEWLIYVVSGLPAEENRRMLVALAPAVREHLSKT